MRPVTRRTITRFVLGLVAFVPAARSLGLGPNKDVTPAALAQPRPPQPPGPPPPPPPPPPVGASLVVERFASGSVMEVNDKRILLTNPTRGTLVLHLSRTTAVWKGGWDSGRPIEVGDQVAAWGEPRAGGTEYDVEKMWVNIVNLQGRISNVRQGPSGPQFRLQDRYLGPQQVAMQSTTLINRPDGRETPFGADLVAPRDGQFLQVIGLRLKDGSVQATRVFLDE